VTGDRSILSVFTVRVRGCSNETFLQSSLQHSCTLSRRHRWTTVTSSLSGLRSLLLANCNQCRMRQPEWHDEVHLDTRVYGPWRSIHTARVYGEAGIHGYSIHTALVGGPCLRAANTVNLDRAPVNMALCLGSGRTRYDTIRDASLTCAQKPT